MNNNRSITDRDEVLLAFQAACPRPSAKDIIEWTTRYPQFADDIRDHAAISLDWAANEGQPRIEIDEDMRSRGHSRALNALYKAEQAAKLKPQKATTRTLRQLFEDCGMSVATIARQIEIERGVLADLIGGRILAPVGKRLKYALLPLLHVDEASFNGSLAQTLAMPAGLQAKAEARPAVMPRSYEEVINDSTMTPERKRYWLGMEAK